MGDFEELMPTIPRTEGTMICKSVGVKSGHVQVSSQEFRAANAKRSKQRVCGASNKQALPSTYKFDLSQSIDKQTSRRRRRRSNSSSMNLHASRQEESEAMTRVKLSPDRRVSNQYRSPAADAMIGFSFLGMLLIACQLSTFASAWRVFDTLDAGGNMARYAGDYFQPQPQFMNNYYPTQAINMQQQQQQQQQQQAPQVQQPNLQPIYNPQQQQQQQQLLTPATLSSTHQGATSSGHLSHYSDQPVIVASQSNSNQFDGQDAVLQQQQRVLNQDQIQEHHEAQHLVVRAAGTTTTTAAPSQFGNKPNQIESATFSSNQSGDNVIARDVSQVNASPRESPVEPVKPGKQLTNESEAREQQTRQDAAPSLSPEVSASQQQQQQQLPASSQPSPYGKILEAVFQTNSTSYSNLQQQQQVVAKSTGGSDNSSSSSGGNNKLASQVALQMLKPKKSSGAGGGNKLSSSTIEQQIIDQHARAAAGYSRASQYSSPSPSSSSSSSSSSGSSLASNSSPQQRLLLPLTKHRDNKLLGSLLLNTLGALGTASSASSSSSPTSPVSSSASSSSDQHASSPLSSLLNNFKSGISSRSSIVKAAISDNKLARTLTTVSKSIGGNKLVASAGIAAALAALGLTMGKFISPYVLSGSQYSKLSEPLMISSSLPAPNYMSQDRNFVFTPSSSPANFGANLNDAMFASASSGPFMSPPRTLGGQLDYSASDYTFGPTQAWDTSQSGGQFAPTYDQAPGAYNPSGQQQQQQQQQQPYPQLTSMMQESSSPNTVYFAHPSSGFSSQQTNYNNNKQPLDSATGHYSTFYERPEIDAADSAPPLEGGNIQAQQQQQQQQQGQYFSGLPSQTLTESGSSGLIDVPSTATNYGLNGGAPSYKSDFRSPALQSFNEPTSAGASMQQQQAGNFDQIMSSSSIDNQIYQKQVPSSAQDKSRASLSAAAATVHQQPPRRSGAVLLKLDESTRNRLEQQFQNRASPTKPYPTSYNYFTYYPKAKPASSGVTGQETLLANQQSIETGQSDRKQPTQEQQQQQQQQFVPMTSPKQQTLMIESTGTYGQWSQPQQPQLQVKQSPFGSSPQITTKSSRSVGSALASGTVNSNKGDQRAQVRVNQAQEEGQLRDFSSKQTNQQQQQQMDSIPIIMAQQQQKWRQASHDKGNGNGKQQVQPTYMLIRPNSIEKQQQQQQHHHHQQHQHQQANADANESLNFKVPAALPIHHAHQAQYQHLQPIVANVREINSSSLPSSLSSSLSSSSSVALSGGWKSVPMLSLEQKQQATIGANQQEQQVAGNGQSDSQDSSVGFQSSEEIEYKRELSNSATAAAAAGQSQLASSNNSISDSLHRVSRAPQPAFQPIVAQFGATKTKSSSLAQSFRYPGANELRDYREPAAQEGRRNGDNNSGADQLQSSASATIAAYDDKLASSDQLQLLAAMLNAQRLNMDTTTGQTLKEQRIVYNSNGKDQQRHADTSSSSSNDVYPAQSSADNSIKSETVTSVGAVAVASRVQGGGGVGGVGGIGGDKLNEVTTTNDNDNTNDELKRTQIRHTSQQTGGVDSKLVDTTAEVTQHQADDESIVSDQQQQHDNNNNNNSENGNNKQSQHQQQQLAASAPIAGDNVVVELLVDSVNDGGGTLEGDKQRQQQQQQQQEQQQQTPSSVATSGEGGEKSTSQSEGNADTGDDDGRRSYRGLVAGSIGDSAN